jgi:hypothetical protein
MKRLLVALATCVALTACEQPTAPPPGSMFVADAGSVEGSPACRSVSGALVLRSEESDGTHFFFEFEVHGDLEGTLSDAIVVDPPVASLPNVVHVSGTGRLDISASTIPELNGRVLVTTVTGIGVRLTSANLGHAFQHTIVEGARRGKIVQQEPVPNFFPYHGEICP